MSFKSVAQRRLFYAMKRRGEMGQKTINEWEDKTPENIPERKKKRKHYGDIIEKAKKKIAYIGERRKWADGVHVKGNDHKWHKETLTQHAIDQLKQDGHHRKKQLVEDFTEAVHGYIDWLHKNDVHPEDATPESDSSFWEEFFDDPEWDEDEGFQKYTDKAHHVAMRFHQYLVEHGKGKGGKEDTQPVELYFADKLLYQRAKDLIGRRQSPTTLAQKMLSSDWGEIGRNEGRILIGHCVDVDGVKGIIVNYWYQRKVVGFNYSTNRRRMEAGGIVTWRLLTPKGEVKVNVNPSKTRIIADPAGPTDKEIRAKGPLADAGIHSLTFDDNIPDHTQKSWSNAIDFAFKQLNDHLGLNFHGKVKIQVYGSKGPKRGATADYSPMDKVVRLSTKKAGSGEALAHELGHALDDKLNNWQRNFRHDTYNHWINEIVRIYRRTEQGKEEEDLLHQVKVNKAERRALGLRTSSIGGLYSWLYWANKPQEIFARCFETYIARKVPKWETTGWAKQPVRENSFAEIEKIFDRMFQDDNILKAVASVLGLKMVYKRKERYGF